MGIQEVYTETEQGVFNLEDIGSLDMEQTWQMISRTNSGIEFGGPRDGLRYRDGLYMIEPHGNGTYTYMQHELSSSGGIGVESHYNLDDDHIESLRRSFAGIEAVELSLDVMARIVQERRAEARAQRLKCLGEAAVRSRNFLFVLVHSEERSDNRIDGHFAKLWGVAPGEGRKPLPVLAGKDGSLGLVHDDSVWYPRLYHGAVK